MTTDTQDGKKVDELNEEGRGTPRPYEDCIAYYIIGALVLEGVIDPYDDMSFEIATRTGLPYAMQVVSDALLAGVKAYGWQGSIGELISAANSGMDTRLARTHRKSVDLDGAE